MPTSGQKQFLFFNTGVILWVVSASGESFNRLSSMPLIKHFPPLKLHKTPPKITKTLTGPVLLRTPHLQFICKGLVER